MDRSVALILAANGIARHWLRRTPCVCRSCWFRSLPPGCRTRPEVTDFTGAATEGATGAGATGGAGTTVGASTDCVGGGAGTTVAVGDGTTTMVEVGATVVVADVDAVVPLPGDTALTPGRLSSPIGHAPAGVTTALAAASDLEPIS